MQTLQNKAIGSLEHFLVTADDWPWSAVSRVAIGFAIQPIFHPIFGDRESVWLFLAFFIGLLVAMRVVPAGLRFALPFSPETKKIWAGRRALAKRYDSYQWQKLLWIGLGLLLYVLIAGDARSGATVVAIICLVGGGVGLWVWRRVSVVPAEP